jgi:hypothetical protein
MDEVIWLSFYNQDYSRSGSIRASLPKETAGTFFCVPSGTARTIWHLSRISAKHPKSIFVIMSPSHLLTIFAKILNPRRKIILDAGWSLWEAQKSRQKARIIETLSVLLIDHISFRLADQIFFESAEQLIFCQKKFRISQGKTCVVYSKVNEKKFEDAKSQCPIEMRTLDGREFMLFRGSFTMEAGIDKLWNLSLSLPSNSSVIVVIATNRKFEDVFPSYKLHKNIIWISRWLSYGEIRWLYQSSTLVFGQLNSTIRTKRTIPHKLFEASYFSKPYVTPAHIPVQTFFESTDSYVPVSSEDFAGKLINVILDDKELLLEIGIKAKRNYQKKCNDFAIRVVFESLITKLLSAK